jgi:hypothetical protein
MTSIDDDWRDLLADPPVPRTFAELMRMIILMAVEDSQAAEMDYEGGKSARRQFQERVGYDIYAEALEFLDAPLFNLPNSPTHGEVLDQAEPRAALWVIPAELKMLREALCLAQTGMGMLLENPDDMDETAHLIAHRECIEALIAEIDRHRPLGPDGKHGELHTPTCGCDTV